jgi:hypothetical protein
VTHLPRDTNVIPCHYVLATKRGPNGEKLKLRARLVANGQHQRYGVDYFDTFTPTCNMITIRTVLCMAAHLDWEVHQVDIKSAYLYADVQEDIYMRPPPGYLSEGEHWKVLKLKRSLLGLKQAGFEWSEELAGVFAKLGFAHSQVDQVVYFNVQWTSTSSSLSPLTTWPSPLITFPTSNSSNLSFKSISKSQTSVN